MANSSQPRLGIIGAGRVGGALARALHRRGYPVLAVWSRTRAHAQALAEDVAARVAARPAEVVAAAELTLLAVPDDVIVPLVAAVAADDGWQPGRAVVHLSGAHGAELLQQAAAAGAHVGALHPLQTFPDGHTAILPGTTFAIEAAEPLHTTLELLAAALGGRPLDLAPGDRPLYHAAAVMTANYAVTLMAQAVALLQRCDIGAERGLAALLPLLRGTVESLGRLGLPDALTGPIARGDAGTVCRHLEALELHAREVLPLYRALGAATLPIAAARGLNPEQVEELAARLGAPGPRAADSD